MTKTSHEFKQELIKALKIEDVNPEIQDDLVLQVEEVAKMRVGNLLEDLLTPEQRSQVEAMEKEGKPGAEIVDFIQNQIPDYEELMQGIMLDVADELKPPQK